MISPSRFQAIRDALDFLSDELGGLSHKGIDSVFVARGMPVPPMVGNKPQRVRASIAAIPDLELARVGTAVLEAGAPDAAARNRLQDALWALGEPPEIPARTRRAIAVALRGSESFENAGRLFDILDRLWVLDANPFESLFNPTSGLRAQIRQHFVRNPDWGIVELFEQLGAFEGSHRRFALFLEGLASADNVPDEDVQRAFVTACQPHLAQVGLALRETDQHEGYPVFALVRAGTFLGRPRIILFATVGKPDLRLSDVLDGKFEVLDNIDVVLAYEQPVGPQGLHWSHLQGWWRKIHGIDDDIEVKRMLFRRLRRSLPQDSPDFDGPHPQRLFFDLYHDIFADSIPDLPALLPEVWLFWDPQSVKRRGQKAFEHQRMDFLMLLPNGARVVIEVDGQQHYAVNGRPAPDLYAKMMNADRDLQFDGYRLFRIGASELRDAERARPLVEDFFRRLFRNFEVPC